MNAMTNEIKQIKIRESAWTKFIYPGRVIGQLIEVKIVESSEEDMIGQSKKLRPDLVEMLKKTAN